MVLIHGKKEGEMLRGNALEKWEEKDNGSGLGKGW